MAACGAQVWWQSRCCSTACRNMRAAGALDGIQADFQWQDTLQASCGWQAARWATTLKQRGLVVSYCTVMYLRDHTEANKTLASHPPNLTHCTFQNLPPCLSEHSFAWHL